MRIRLRNAKCRTKVVGVEGKANENGRDYEK